jgi:hypothetical protein
MASLSFGVAKIYFSGDRVVNTFAAMYEQEEYE